MLSILKSFKIYFYEYQRVNYRSVGGLIGLIDYDIYMIFNDDVE